MTKYITTIILLSGILFSTTGTAATRKGDLLITTFAPHNNNHSHGYVENRLQIQNLSLTKTHSIRLQAPSYTYSAYSDSINSIERSVTIAPGTSLTTSLPVPALPVNGNNTVKIFIDGHDKGSFAMPSLNNSYRGYGGSTLSIMVSRTFNAQSIEDAIKTSGVYPKKSPGTPKIIYRTEEEINSWSRNWLGYSCYDAIILHRSDVETMPQTLQDTLHNYVSVGGVVVVAGTLDFPFNWPHTKHKTINNATKYICDFGCVILLQADKIATLPKDELKIITQTAEKTLHPWNHSYSLSSANKLFPVMQNMTLPTRSMFAALLIFSIIIGPVLLIVLARKNRRIWLLWIAPAISFVVCVIITIYSIMSEGITPFCRIASLSILNQNTHHCSTIGMLSIYCPLTPSGGLHFKNHTEISHFLNTGYSSRGTGRYINWTHDQNLSQGWVTARVPSIFQVRIPEMRRERIEFSTKDGKPFIVNGLGASITKLWLCDADGNYFCYNKKVKPGAKIKLEPAPAPPKTKHTTRDIYTSEPWTKTLTKKLSSNEISNLLKPNMYLAILDDSPFITSGLKGRIHKNNKAFVIGILPNHNGDR